MVNALPTAPTVSTPVTYCVGATATALTATKTSASDTLYWYTVATGGTGSLTAPTPSTASAGTTNYYVSQKNVNGCEGSRALIAVVVNALPTAPTVSTPVTYCVGATATALTATKTSASDTLYWYTVATGGTGSLTAPTPSTASAGTTNYYVSQKNVNGCEGPRALIAVVVSSLPSSPTVTSPVNYCQGATASPLTATGTGLLWYTVATGGTGSSTAPTPSTAIAGTTNYYVSQTSGGCESPRALIAVVVSATPAAPIVSSPVSYCIGATASPLTATGTSLLWYTAATGGTGSSTAPTPSTSSIGTTNYYVSQTSGGCESPRALISVVVNGLPSAPTVSSPVTLCYGETASPLTAIGSGLLWYTVATGGTGSSIAPTPSTAIVGLTLYYVSQTVSGCESPRATLAVNVRAIPLAPTVSTPVQYCLGATASALTATAATASDTLKWYTSPTGGVGSTTAPVPSTATAGTTFYYVSQTSSGTSCEGVRAAIAVIVRPLPVAPTVSTPINYCIGATATALTATKTSTTDTLKWYTVATGGTGSLTAPIPSTASVGTTNYYVSQVSQYGCEGPRALIAVVVNALPTAPTVSTPVTYCVGATATALTATKTSASDTLYWYTVATGGTGSLTAPTPSTASAGTTNYYVSQKNVNGCEGPRALIAVVVNPSASSPTFTSPVTYCQDASTSALVATGSGIKWYSTSTGGTASTTAPTPSSSIPRIITYYLTATTGLGCETYPRAELIVVINPKPDSVKITALSATTFCTGDSVILNGSTSIFSGFGSTAYLQGSATSGTPFTCDCPNGSVVVGYEGSTGSLLDQFRLICKPINRFGVLGATTTVTAYNGINPGPVSVSPILLSGTGMLIGIKAAGTTWPGPSLYTYLGGVTGYGQSQSYINSFGDNSSSPLTLGSMNGWSAIGDYGTVFTPRGTVSSGMYSYPSFYSSGLSLRYTPIGAYKYTYSWSSAPTTDTNSSITVKTTGTYTVTVTNSLGCSATSSPVNVIVNTLPLAPTVITPVTYCQGSTASALTATGTGLKWYTAASGGTGSTTAPIPSTAVAGTTNYYVSQTNTTTGCEGPRALITVVVNPTPLAPSVTSPVTYCQGATASALTATGIGLKWYTVSTGGTGSTAAPTPSTATAGTTIYYVSQTTALGCEGPRSAISVVVNPTPALPTVVSPVNYCLGVTSSALTATGIGLKWYTVATGGTGSTTAPTPSTTTVGTTNYYVSQTTALGCEGSRALIAVVVNPLPNPGITVTETSGVANNDNIICLGDAATFTASGGGTYQWYNNGTFLTSSTSFSAGLTSVGTAVVKLIVTSSFGCIDSTTASVTATPLPTAITGTLSSCIGGTSTLSSVGSTPHGTTPWSSSNTGVATISSSGIVTAISAGTTVITYRNNNNCTITATFTVNPTPSLPIVSTPVNYCQGATASALTATGSSLLWYTTPIGGTGSATAPTPSTASAGTTSYYVSQTLLGCEGPRATINVVVNPLPGAPTVTTPVTYCQGAIASALTATGTGLKWYTVATGGTGSTTAPTPSTATAGTTNYYVSQTISATGCEGPRALIAVVVNPLPSLPIVSTPITYCQGATASALTATGIGLKWYTVATGGTGTTTAPTPSTTAAGTTVYYVSQTTALGCEGPRSAISVIVNPTPTLPSVVSPVNYCQGATSSALTATGSSLMWYTVASGGTGSAIAPTPSTASVGTTSYYVSQTLLGCEGPRATINVVVNPLPSAPTVTTPITYCQGATASALTATGTGLKWYTVATGGTGSTTAPTPSTAAAGTTNYYVSQTNATTGCEGTRAMIAVVVNPLPIAPTVTTPITYCLGATPSVLSATGTGLKWYTVATGGTGSTTAPTPSTVVAGTTNYYVTQTNASTGCESPRALISVVVNPLPTAPTVTTPVNYCQGATASALTATGTGLLWYSTATGGTGSAIAPTPSTATVGATNYYVSQTNPTSGCEGPRALIVVSINPIPAAPTVTTPINLCLGGASSALTASGINLKWYTVATGGTASTVAPVPSTAAVGTTDYYVSQTSTFGCESPRAMISVTVNSLPTVTITSKSPYGFIYCRDLTVTLQANSPTAKFYNWRFAGVTIPGATADTIAAGSTGIWGVTVRDTFGCIAKDSVFVSQAPTTEKVVLTPESAKICEEGSVLLTCSPGFVSFTYDWHKDGLPILPATPTSNLINASTAGTYIVYVMNNYGCFDTTNVSIVSYHPKPIKPVITNSAPLLQIPSVYTYYQWYRNGKMVFGANTHQLLTTTGGIYHVEVTDLNGCLNYSDTVTLIDPNGIQNVVSEEVLRIYPNPTNSIVNIDAPVSIDVEVADLTGRKVYSGKDVKSVNMENLADGTYIFRIFDENHQLITVQKINKISN